MNIKHLFLVLPFLFVIVYGVTYMNKQNKLVKLENTIEALQAKQASFYDGFWKTLRQTAQVDTAFVKQEQKYFQTWQDAISKTANFTEAANKSFIPMLFNQAGLNAPNPEFKRKIMQIVEDGNVQFENRRNEIIAAVNQYNNFVRNPWNSIYFIPSEGKNAMDYIITSARTKNALNTGEDNDTNIY